MRRQIPVLALLLLVVPVQAQTPSADAALVARAEALVDALIAGNTETVAADFNEQMQAALSPEQLAGLAPSLHAQLGAPRERVGTRVEAQPPITTVVVTQRFERATADVLVSFDAEGRVAGLFVRPTPPPPAPPTWPPYADSSRYRTEGATVDAGVGLPLGATLLVPDADGPVPGVVLVHGSGPSDRDGTQGPNKPLRDLAVGFASEGVSTLRFDKRTTVYPASFADTTYTVAEESIDDALAALDVLRRHPGIDPARLFVVGHSLGGTLAPRIAQRAAQRGTPVAGIAVLAGGARPLDVILEDQLAHLDDVAPEGASRRAPIRDDIARIRALTPADTSRADPIFHAPPAYWLDLAVHPPAPIAAALGVPVLVVHAGRDYNVPDADFAVWQGALADAPGATLRRYPTLNHLLFAGEGLSTPAEYERQGFVDAALVRETAAWIRGER
ncbi:MAG: alpha/beta fold hydrolase [Rhodothermales bacterium]